MNRSLSIVIPAYNAERFIGEQLEALSRVRMDADSEIIVVNNRSTDRTREVVEAAAKLDPRVRLVDAPARSGVNYARNTGVSAAHHENIVIFDADDVVIAENCERFVQLFDEADFFGGGYTLYLWDPATRSFHEGKQVLEAPTTADGRPYGIGAALGFTKTLFERVGGFDESYVGGHDEVDFALRAYRLGARFAWLVRPVIRYRQRSDIRAAIRQKYHYGRTSVQLALNFPDELGSSVPGYKLLARKAGHAALNWWSRRRTDSAGEALQGLGWTVGRLGGALTYRALGRLPQRQLLTASTDEGRRRRLLLLSPWNMDDPNAWSGVVYPAVRELEKHAEVTRVPVPEVKDALVDRVAAKLLGKTEVVYLPHHALATGLKRAWAVRRAVRRYPAQPVVALAASTESLLIPRAFPILQVTDSSFAAMATTYFGGSTRLAGVSRVQGVVLDRLVAARSRGFSVASRWSSEVIGSDVRVAPEKILLNPFGPGVAPVAFATPAQAEHPLKVLFVSSHWERKGGQKVLDAVERARANREIELTVVGKVPADLPGWVRHLPRLSREELSAEYARNHMLLELSSASAGGVVATDAVAHGLSLIATDLGGLPTIVGESGWLVPVEQAVGQTARLLSDLTAEQIAEAQAHSRQRAAAYLNWERWAERLLSVLPE